MARSYRKRARRQRGRGAMQARSAVYPRGGIARGIKSGQGITVQHDARTIYRKKRSNPRRRKLWKRFSRKVHAVAEKDFGSRTVVMNKGQSFANAVSNQHGVAYLGLYTLNGVDSWQADLANISGLENTGDETAAAGINVTDTTKFIFQSGIMDVTFRNTSTVKSGILDLAASEAKLEVDVYEMTSKRRWSDAAGNYSDITTVLTRGLTLTKNLSGTGSGITILNRGVTPWDAPAALSYFGLSILKKTKYFLNNGDTFTYQIRDPKRHTFTQEWMQQGEGGNVPKVTRHLFVVFKLVPGLTIGTLEGQYTEGLTMGLTRKYLYKVEGANDDRDRYLNNT